MRRHDIIKETKKFFSSLIIPTLCRFERPPVLEPKHWWHKVPIKRKNVFRRVALETLGANNLISDHTIVRAHDRAQPMLIKMFMSSNYGKRDFKATESKVTRFIHG